MGTLSWGETADYSEGVARGVAYFANGVVRAWNGLVSVDENPSDGSVTTLYFDGVGYNTHRSKEEFAATLTAFTYPLELDDLILQQGLGLSYFENDRIHLIYNATLTPQNRLYKTESSDVDLSLFAWDISTTPIEVENAHPTSHLIIDTKGTKPEVLVRVLDALYGSVDNDPYLPTTSELLEIFHTSALLVIVNHGDGTWTATGPDHMVRMLDATTFEITSPSVVYIDEDTYTVSSW